MRLRRSLNLALLAALGTAAAASWFAGRGDGGSPALTDLEPREVRSVEVRFPRAQRPALRLERGQDGWSIREPIERAARDGRVVSALAVLAAPRGNSCYEAGEHDLGAFGLAEPLLELAVDDRVVAFGDRAADGRRYVRAGEHFCLLSDRYWPLLKDGLDGLAQPGLLAPGHSPSRIATPEAEARRDGEAGGWRFIRGTGDAERWAARWRTARASGIVLDPPMADLGTIRIASSGAIEAWRIAAREPDLVLVPSGADHGLRIPAKQAGHLLEPPAAGNED